MSFQSSPDLWAGCYVNTSVTILTYHEFQSSPDLWAGCYDTQHGSDCYKLLFQSSPDLWAGCYPYVVEQGHGLCHVSILTRPMGRVLLEDAVSKKCWDAVSILTRPMGRVLRRPCTPKYRGTLVSILTRPMGRVLHLGGWHVAERVRLFQSSPDLWAGCYRGSAGPKLRECSHVSILTRPMGRVLLNYLN